MAPEDVGGFDGGGAEIMAVATEMAPLSLGTVSGNVRHGCATSRQLWHGCTKTYILPKVLDDANIAVALYEPGQRYDVAPQATTAKMDGDGFVLNGAKAVVVKRHARWIAIGAKLENIGSAVFMVDACADGMSSKPYRLVDGRGAAGGGISNVRVDADARMVA